MKIGFIGAGKVGYSLGKYFKDKNGNVIGYYSKELKHAQDAARFTNTECYTSISNLAYNCDTLFLTVNDNQISQVVDELVKLKIKKKNLIHTSGCNSSLIFKELNDYNACYSMHPIFAFNDKYESYKSLNEMALTIEGNKDISNIMPLLNLIGNKYQVIDRKDKIKYHASCVMMSNYVNALVYESLKMFKEIGFEDESLIMPLFINNALSINNEGPIKSLTGPVSRNDTSTVNCHLNVLEGEEKVIYKDLAKILVEMSKQNNNLNYEEMEKLLRKED